MTPGVTRVVVLGSSLTALGVLRNIRSCKLTSVLFDTERGIATRSSIPQLHVACDPSEGALLSNVCSLGNKERSALIATSDRWLRFILKYRDELENSYDKILHPKNSSLSLCLDKKDFLEWCAKNGIPVPFFHTFVREGEFPSEGEVPEDRFPLLLRPRSTFHSTGSGKIPKALEVIDYGELQGALGLFFAAGTDVVATESLLGHRITQFSIPAARSRDGMISFVAEKVRPLPLHCAVGTYVRLRPDHRIESIARNALERMGYEGIAEVEILRSHDTGSDYVIEINARPWIQYNLSTQSGHDFLRFLLDPESYDPSKQTKYGRSWINFREDLFVCFSRSIGLVRLGNVGFPAYLSSLLRANVHSKFDFSDPWPFVFDTWDCVRDVLRRHGP